MNIQKFDYSANILPSVLWQYDQAINLLNIIRNKQEWLDENQTVFWNLWYSTVFNISAENLLMSNFGLNVWSFILNVPSFIPLSVSDDEIWGFNSFNPTFPTFTNDNLNFDNAPFAASIPVINLNAAQQHFLILLKYFNCTSRLSIQSFLPNTYEAETTPENVYSDSFLYDVNTYLQYLCFNLGESIGYSTNTIFCHDNLDLTISYVFSDLSAFPTALRSAIDLLKLWPKPAGIKISSFS